MEIVEIGANAHQQAASSAVLNRFRTDVASATTTALRVEEEDVISRG